MKAFAVSIELIARTALFMTVVTLSFRHMLQDRKTAKTTAGEDHRH